MRGWFVRGGKSRIRALVLGLALAAMLGLAACRPPELPIQSDRQSSSQAGKGSGSPSAGAEEAEESFSWDRVPAYDGSAFAVMHKNRPYFSREEIRDWSGQSFTQLDALGRCGVARAKITPELMPTERRGEIGSVKPSGWHTVKYADSIQDRYLYNRCHLIGYQLTGQNANPKNLITGTRYMNASVMEPFESLVASYVKKTGKSVAYRVTPVFVGSELVARGVLMEAYSDADQGESICYCVFCYNMQPGISINYGDGSSQPDGNYHLSDGTYFSRGFIIPKINTGSYKN